MDRGPRREYCRACGSQWLATFSKIELLDKLLWKGLTNKQDGLEIVSSVQKSLVQDVTKIEALWRVLKNTQQIEEHSSCGTIYIGLSGEWSLRDPKVLQIVIS